MSINREFEGDPSEALARLGFNEEEIIRLTTLSSMLGWARIHYFQEGEDVSDEEALRRYQADSDPFKPYSLAYENWEKFSKPREFTTEELKLLERMERRLEEKIRLWELRD